VREPESQVRRVVKVTGTRGSPQRQRLVRCG
jgi:hypothetical protein